MIPKKTIAILLLALFLLSATALAAVPSPTQAFNDLGRFFADLVRGGPTFEKAYLLTFVLYFIIFLAIFVEGLRFIPFFGQQGEINTAGKWFAFAAAMLATLGIFLAEQSTGKSTSQLVQHAIAPFGVWAGFVLALLFAWTSFWALRHFDLFKDDILMPMAIAASIGLTIAGWLLSYDSLASYGFLIMLIVMVVGLIMHWGRTRSEAKELQEPEREEKQASMKLNAGLKRTLGRSLKRIYRYNKKVVKDFDVVLKALAKNNFSAVENKLKNAKKLEGREIKFDALANDIVEDIAGEDTQIKKELNLFNKKLQLDLTELKQAIEQAQDASSQKKSDEIRNLVEQAKGISQQIVEDILALESVVKGLSRELEK